MKAPKIATLILATLTTLAFGLGCGADEPPPEPPRPDPAAYVWPAGPNPTAVLEIDGMGEIEIELYPSLAPSTVKNFSKLATNGFYAGTTFHRVIPDYMIQGGDPNSKDDDPSDDGRGGPGWNIQDEFSDAPHVRGVLAMANLGSSNTGSSQFFIVQKDAPSLDGKHAIFGRVTRGMEIVDAIAAVETDTYGRWGPANRPLANVVINDIAIHQPAEREATIAAIESDV